MVGLWCTCLNYGIFTGASEIERGVLVLVGKAANEGIKGLDCNKALSQYPHRPESVSQYATNGTQHGARKRLGVDSVA